jgi:hypothetical protein
MTYKAPFAIEEVVIELLKVEHESQFQYMTTALTEILEQGR